MTVSSPGKNASNAVFMFTVPISYLIVRVYHNYYASVKSGYAPLFTLTSPSIWECVCYRNTATENEKRVFNISNNDGEVFFFRIETFIYVSVAITVVDVLLLLFYTYLVLKTLY